MPPACGTECRRPGGTAITPSQLRQSQPAPLCSSTTAPAFGTVCASANVLATFGASVLAVSRIAAPWLTSTTKPPLCSARIRSTTGRNRSSNCRPDSPPGTGISMLPACQDRYTLMNSSIDRRSLRPSRSPTSTSWRPSWTITSRSCGRAISSAVCLARTATDAYTAATGSPASRCAILSACCRPSLVNGGPGGRESSTCRTLDRVSPCRTRTNLTSHAPRPDLTSASQPRAISKSLSDTPGATAAGPPLTRG